MSETDRTDYRLLLVPEQEMDLLYPIGRKNDNCGCLGYLRGDFGRNGKEFWFTWFDQQADLKTKAFKDEFDSIINNLREDNILKDFSALYAYCHEHREAWLACDSLDEAYGFKIETECFSYYLRALPVHGSYHFYIYCYDRKLLFKALRQTSKD